MSESLPRPPEISWYKLIEKQKERRNWRADRHFVLAQGSWSEIVDWCLHNFPDHAWSWGNHENLQAHVPLYFVNEADSAWAKAVWT